MKVFICADHRGFFVKQEIIPYLIKKEIEVIDIGNVVHDPLDDFPPLAQKVARSVQKDPYNALGIVICGSGVGVSISANRFKNIRCGLCFNIDQTESAKKHDHMNVLAIPADYIDLEYLKKIIDTFLTTDFDQQEKYKRRLNQIEEIL